MWDLYKSLSFVEVRKICIWHEGNSTMKASFRDSFWNDWKIAISDEEPSFPPGSFLHTRSPPSHKKLPSYQDSGSFLSTTMLPSYWETSLASGGSLLMQLILYLSAFFFKISSKINKQIDFLMDFPLKSQVPSNHDYPDLWSPTFER